MNEIDALQGIWRRANAEGEGVTIKCQSPSEAKRVRFLLYNAVREARKPFGIADEALREAVKACGVSFAEDDPSTVVVRQKLRTGLMEKILEAAGDYAKPDAASAESLAKVQAMLAQDQTPVGGAAEPMLRQERPFHYPGLGKKRDAE